MNVPDHVLARTAAQNTPQAMIAAYDYVIGTLLGIDNPEAHPLTIGLSELGIVDLGDMIALPPAAFDTLVYTDTDDGTVHNVPLALTNRAKIVSSLFQSCTR